MAEFLLTFSFIDDRNGVTDKSFPGEFADYTTAETAAALFLTDFQAITGAGIYKWSLAQINYPASTPTAGARVTDRMSATVFLNQAQGKKANLKTPAPAAAILSGNLLNQTAAWQAFIAHLTATGGWEISDGEHVDDTGGNGTVSGKLVSVRSGVRTLPT